MEITRKSFITATATAVAVLAAGEARADDPGTVEDKGVYLFLSWSADAIS